MTEKAWDMIECIGKQAEEAYAREREVVVPGENHSPFMSAEQMIVEQGKETKAALDAQADIIAELEAKIDKLRAGERHLSGRIDKAELRIITEERARKSAEETLLRLLSDGDMALLGRMDKLERDLNALRTLTLGHAIERRDIMVEMMREHSRTHDDLKAFQKRAIEADPRLGKPTIQQQCKAVEWRPPTEEGENADSRTD